IEAMEGEPLRELSIRTELRGGDFAGVAVSDTGPGLSPEVRGRLFEAFASTKASGMGLGLSICRSIIEAHGGMLDVDPPACRGATFRFSVPLVREGDDAA